MSEKTGNIEKMEYLFNESQHMEIFLPKAQRWHRVTCNDFRSWDGERRIEGEVYDGPLYAYGTNRKVSPKHNNKIIASEVLTERNARSQKIR